MQSASSRIWSRVAVSISYDDHHNTSGLWHINIYLLVNAKSILIQIIIIFQTTQFSMNTQFNCQKWKQWRGFAHSLKIHQYWKLTIRVSTLISRTLFAGVGYYHSADVQSVYSVAPDDWATRKNFGRSYPPADLQSVYSTDIADRAILFGFQWS